VLLANWKNKCKQLQRFERQAGKWVKFLRWKDGANLQSKKYRTKKQCASIVSKLLDNQIIFRKEN
jgi:hypothetical protein